MEATKNKSKGLILLSGGLDSLALASYLKSNFAQDLDALFINWGQTAYKMEADAINLIESKQLIQVNKIYRNSFCISEAKRLLTQEIKEDFGIPGRNLIMISMAIPLAFSLSCSKIFLGSLPNDGFPDSTEEFIGLVNDLIQHVSKKKLLAEAPFVEHGWTKDNIIKWIHDKIGSEAFGLCYSCWEGNEKHCGSCRGCMTRKYAFRKAGIFDPTEYIYKGFD